MLNRFLSALCLAITLPLLALAQDVPVPPPPPETDVSAAELAATESDDKGFLTRFLQSKLSKAGRSVVIDGFKGALSSRATFDRITIADADGVWLTLHNGAIQWNRSALLRGRVEIAELAAKRIEIPRKPLSGEREQAAKEDEPPVFTSFRLPELPVSLEIEQIDADRVVLGEALIGDEAEVTVTGALSLVGGEGVADLDISRVDGKKGDFSFAGSFNNDTRMLDIDLVLDEDPAGIFSRFIEGKPAVSAEIKGSGPLDDFDSDIRLATDGVERISGKVSLDGAEGPDGAQGQRFDIDLGGDIASLLPPGNRDFFGDRSRIAARGWRGAEGQFALDAIQLDTDAVKLSGSLATNAAKAPQKLDLAIDLGQQAGATTLPVRVPFVEPPITVNSGQLQLVYDATQGSGWSLKGWLERIDRAGIRLDRLELDGAGKVRLAEATQSVEQVDGKLGFDASGLTLMGDKLQQAVGSQISGTTNFDITPGDVLRLTAMNITGKDYALAGDLSVDGLSSGIVLSGTDLVARHDALGNLSALAGRPLSGAAEARISGYFQLLSQDFDIEADITGTDLHINQERVDHLLAGKSTSHISVARLDDVISLRDVTVNAQRITLAAAGELTEDATDVTITFDMPTLADLDPNYRGAIAATAHISGENGARKVLVKGDATGLETGIEQLDGALAGRTGLDAALHETKGGGFELTDLTLNNDQLTIDGGGSFAADDIDAAFNLNVADLSALGAGLAGAVEANLQVETENGVRQITMRGTGQDLALGQTDLDNALMGETIFAVNAQQKGDLIKLQDAQIENDQIRMNASGTMSDAGINAEAQIDIDRLAALGRGWQGAFSADAQLTQGPNGTRQITVSGEGLDMALGQDVADSALTGRTGVNLYLSQKPGEALYIEALDLTNDQMVINAQGSYEQGAIEADAEFSVQDFAALGRGWAGSLDGTAQVSTDEAGTRRVVVDATGEDLRFGPAEGSALTGPTRIDIVTQQARDGAISIERADIDNTKLSVQAQGVISDAETNATAQIKAADLAALGTGAQGALDVEARFVDTGNGQRRLTVKGSAQDLALGNRQDNRLEGQTLIDAEAIEEDGNFTIERAALTHDKVEIRAEGVIGKDRTDARAEVKIADLSALGLGMSGTLDADATVQGDAAQGRDFTLTGTARDLALGQAAADNALRGDTKIDLRGIEREGVITLQSARIENPQLRAEAEGQIGGGATALDGSIEADDLSFLGRGFAGAVKARGRVEDVPRGRIFQAEGTANGMRVGNPQADAALAGATRFEVEGSQAGGATLLQTVQLENPQLSLSGEARLGGGVNSFTGDFAASDLSFLGPRFGGAVEASGTVADQAGQRRFDLTGNARNLSTGVAQLDEALSGTTNFSAQGHEEAGVITLDAVQAKNARLSASASGVYGAGQTDLRADLRAGDLGFVSDRLSGALDATTQITDLGNGRRRIVANGTANGLGIGNEKLDSLLAGQTRFDLAATQGPDGLTIERLDARNPQAQIIADGNPAEGLNFDARLVNLGPLIPGIPGPAQATGTVRQGPDGTQLDLAVTAPGGTRAQVAGRIAGAQTDLRMSGISNAAIANPFMRTRSVQGPISFDLRMQGAPGLQALSGTVSLRDGRLAEPKFGLSMDDLSLDARLDGGRIALDGGGSLDAGGAVRVGGGVDLTSGSPVLDINARLDGAVLRDPNLYEMTVNGAVSITGRAADGPFVGGTLNIAEAELRIPSTGLGGASAIPDMIHRNDSWEAAATRAKAGLEPYGSVAAQAADLGGPAATPPPNPARFDLTINAPNQIFVRGRGVDAEMGGSLQITGNARNPIPIGHLELIRGRVDLLGKRFDLTEGLIELQGSLIPVLRLVATHLEGGITTSIIIDGELRDPEIRFESNPELPQEEVLSHLLFGRGLDEISPLQAAQLANAMAVLAGKGGIGVVGNIREAAGLDELDLTMDEDGDVAVRAGKYLSRNVYTDVELNGDGETRLNLNLDLSDSLTARGSTSSDGESSLGLFYERDY